MLGGGGGAQQIQAAPVPLPAAPVTESDQAVVQAEHDVAKSNLLKKSFNKTRYAGETGGFYAPGSNPMGGTPFGTKPK